MQSLSAFENDRCVPSQRRLIRALCEVVGIPPAVVVGIVATRQVDVGSRSVHRRVANEMLPDNSGGDVS